MPRLFEQALKIDFRIAETAARHRTRSLDDGEQFTFVFRRQHAYAAAAARRLDQHRITDLARRRHYGFGFHRQNVRTFGHRHAVLRRDFTGARLVPHRVYPLGRRTDEMHAGVLHFLRELRIFR